ncbi:MAG: hypothetical protein Q9179_004308 [Wetmoreana sp. 5 TL-2023]
MLTWYKHLAYVMPNDEAELDRLDLTHQKLRILLNDRLLLCPVKNPERILDVGTGTGIWAIEYGDDNPNTSIIGTDLSPTQPSCRVLTIVMCERRVPPNVKFEVDDCEQPWTFTEKFDVVHARYLAAAIEDWPRLVSQAFEFTKPGGYAEFQDYDLQYYSEDGTLTENLSISNWINTLLQASRDFKRDPCPGPKLAGYMRDAGFKEVQEFRYKLPIGPWPRDKHLKVIGSWNLIQIEEGLEAFTLRLYTQFLGWRTEEVQVLLANVRKDLRDPKIHAQFDLHHLATFDSPTHVIRQSNEQLRHLPPHLSSPTAVFTGATQGIGLATLHQLAIHTVQPTCYIVGRSEGKVQEIINELKRLNAKGTYVFVKGEVSLLESVDECCEKIKGMIGEGTGLDLLYMSQGFLSFGGRDETKEGLDTLLSLPYYSRLRFVHNLLPLLSRAYFPHVVSVLAAGREGRIYEDDLSLKYNYGVLACANHGTTMTSLVFEHLAKENSEVAFIHVYPGYPLAYFFKYILQPLLTFFETPIDEVSERQVFHATSARYPSLSHSSTSSIKDAGVALPQGVEAAEGSNGIKGSGAYLTSSDYESTGTGTGKLMTGYRERGLPEKIWRHTFHTFKEVRGG